MSTDNTALPAELRLRASGPSTDRTHQLMLEAANEIERLRDELTHRKRQQVIMYSCLENIREGRDFEGCKRAADIALIAVRQITADMLGTPRDAEGESENG